jgi:hypothetical protein
MKAVRTRIRDLADRRRRAGVKDIREVIRDLNPVLRGWGNTFCTGNASEKFRVIDRDVEQRPQGLLRKHGGQRGFEPGGRPFRKLDRLHARFVREFGLHESLGTIRYPGRSDAA